MSEFHAPTAEEILELRPKKVFPELPDLDLPEPRYRVGRRNGHTIYLQAGDEPADDDIFIGACVNPGAAFQIVMHANVGMRQG